MDVLQCDGVITHCKLVEQDPDTPAPVAELWKPAQREKLADMLAATLKQAVGEGAR